MIEIKGSLVWKKDIRRIDKISEEKYCVRMTSGGDFTISKNEFESIKLKLIENNKENIVFVEKYHNNVSKCLF